MKVLPLRPPSCPLSVVASGKSMNSAKLVGNEARLASSS